MGRKARTLRDTLKCDDRCQKRFEKAEILAMSILRGKSHRHLTPLPFYTPHAYGHCKAVEKYLDEIIWTRKEKSRYDFIPNAEEAMYLLSAVWLHDIGMWYGLWDDEELEHLKDVKKVVQLYENREQRTSWYIHEKWDGGEVWSSREREYLSMVCMFHRSKHPISYFDPPTIRGNYVDGDVRLSALAALLRLADALHVDESRAPDSLENLYISLGMKGEALGHWNRAGLIKGVKKDETDISNKKIRITGNYPEPHRFELGEFDLKEVGDIVCGDVRADLWSVRAVLSRYSNTRFVDVIHDFRRMKALGKAEEGYLALWPYLLSKLTSSTETTAALVEILLIAVQGESLNSYAKGAWRNEVSMIIDKMRDSRPWDFMIRNLCNEVKTQLASEDTSAKNLALYLRSFKRRLGADRDKMAGYGVSIIGEGDYLIVYGHSTNTLRMIEEVPQKQKRHLYIIECYKKTDTLLKENEDERIRNRVAILGFGSVRFVHFHALAQVLAELRDKKKTCKLLLGAHGVLRKGKERGAEEFVCKTGSCMAASIANSSEVAKVVMFAGENKEFKNSLLPERSVMQEVMLRQEGRLHPDIGTYLAPTMDIVPALMVDYYVSEKGVFSQKAPGTLTTQTSVYLTIDDSVPDEKIGQFLESLEEAVEARRASSPRVVETEAD
jgi:translation initiation factor 2B subunit (eIF-2B alpha/beta/delta family)